jgi:hypothetical protein
MPAVEFGFVYRTGGIKKNRQISVRFDQVVDPFTRLERSTRSQGRKSGPLRKVVDDLLSLLVGQIIHGWPRFTLSKTLAIVLRGPLRRGERQGP